MDNPFSWESLTSTAGTDEVFNPFGIAFLVLFGVGFVVSLFLYNDGARRYTGHALKLRVLRRGASIAATVFGIGLFFFGIRALQIDPLGLGMRLWLWLSLIAAVLMVLYFSYYLRTVYQSELKAYEARKLKAQYLRPAAAMAGGQGRAVQRTARTDQPRTAKRRRHGGRKKGRAPPVDRNPPAYRRPLAPAGKPHVTRGGQLTAATFRS